MVLELGQPSLDIAKVALDVVIGRPKLATKCRQVVKDRTADGLRYNPSRRL
jgi:hypothetical protein